MNSEIIGSVVMAAVLGISYWILYKALMQYVELKVEEKFSKFVILSMRSVFMEDSHIFAAVSRSLAYCVWKDGRVLKAPANLALKANLHNDDSDFWGKVAKRWEHSDCNVATDVYLPWPYVYEVLGTDDLHVYFPEFGHGKLRSAVGARKITSGEFADEVKKLQQQSREKFQAGK